MSPFGIGLLLANILPGHYGNFILTMMQMMTMVVIVIKMTIVVMMMTMVIMLMVIVVVVVVRVMMVVPFGIGLLPANLFPGHNSYCLDL